MNRHQLERKLVRSLDLKIPVPMKSERNHWKKILYLAPIIPVSFILLVVFIGQQDIPFHQTLISTLSIRSQQYVSVTKAEADQIYPITELKGYQHTYQMDGEDLSIELTQNSTKVSLLIRPINLENPTEKPYLIKDIPVYFYQDKEVVIAKFMQNGYQFSVNGNCSKKELIRIVKNLIK